MVALFSSMPPVSYTAWLSTSLKTVPVHSLAITASVFDRVPGNDRELQQSDQLPDTQILAHFFVVIKRRN